MMLEKLQQKSKQVITQMTQVFQARGKQVIERVAYTPQETFQIRKK
jgi:hypothetical protein